MGDVKLVKGDRYKEGPSVLVWTDGKKLHIVADTPCPEPVDHITVAYIRDGDVAFAEMLKPDEQYCPARLNVRRWKVEVPDVMAFDRIEVSVTGLAPVTVSAWALLTAADLHSAAFYTA